MVNNETRTKLHPLLRDLFGSLALVGVCVLAAHLLAGGAA